MINFNVNQESNTFSVYPETASLDPSASYSVTLTDDLDLTSGSFDVALINTPTNFNPRLVFQVSGSSIQPTNTGQYTFELFESLIERLIWGTANLQFGSTHVQWGAGAAGIGTKIDTDRVWLEGDNTPTTTTYTTNNELGSFTTYNS